MDYISILGNIIKNWGILAGFHFVVLSVVLYILFHRTERGKTIFSHIKEVLFGNKPKNDLANHIMFVNLRKYINYDIQHFTLNEKLREAIFKDFLMIKFTIVKLQFEQFLSRGDLDAMSDKLYQEKMQECISDIVKSYEYKAKEMGIPDVAIARFNEWYDDKVQAMYAFIITVCEDTDIYNDNYTKTRVIFDFINHINNFTILGIKKVLLSFNGELNKQSYKGIVYDGGPKNVQ